MVVPRLRLQVAVQADLVIPMHLLLSHPHVFVRGTHAPIVHLAVLGAPRATHSLAPALAVPTRLTRKLHSGHHGHRSLQRADMVADAHTLRKPSQLVGATTRLREAVVQLRGRCSGATTSTPGPSASCRTAGLLRQGGALAKAPACLRAPLPVKHTRRKAWQRTSDNTTQGLHKALASHLFCATLDVDVEEVSHLLW